MSESLIYVAEDDDNIREILRCTLDSYGYATRVFDSAPQLLEAVREQLPDLILMDIMMPGMDGLQALRLLKQERRTAGVPVIFLTAKSSEIDKVKGLDLGAEDYITKPFGLLELAARVRAALRRQPPERQHILRGGDIVVDVDDHAVTRAGQPLELTLKEFELLRILIANRERVVPREERLNEIWGADVAGETRTLDLHIKTLRATRRDDVGHPPYIKTIRAVGYKFIG